MGTILKLPIVSNTVRPKTTWQGGFSFTKWFVTWHLQKVNTHVLKDCKNKNNQLTFALKMRFRKFTQINFKINLFWLKWSKVPTWNEHVLVYLWVKPITCYSRFKNTQKRLPFQGLRLLHIDIIYIQIMLVLIISTHVMLSPLLPCIYECNGS